MLPLLKILVNEVAVWGIPSIFVHLTVLPALILIVSGKKAKFWMFTEAPENVFGGFEPLLFEQLQTAKTAEKITRVI